MSARGLLGLLLVVGVAGWLYTHRASSPVPASAGATGSVWSPTQCVRLGEQANEAVREASLLLLRPPVEPAAWSGARSKADTAIAAAEACGAAAATDADRRAWDPLRGALSSMRSLLSDLDGAARGGEAGSVPQQQERVDAQLEAARAALRQ